MKKTAVLAGLMTMISAVSLGAGKAMPIGLGVSTNQADVRFMLDGRSAIDAFVNLGISSGDADTTDFGAGGYYVANLRETKPVYLHWLAGASFGTGKTSVTVSLPVIGPTTSTVKTNAFSLFGGIGAEYFLPGTEVFSLEANVGARLEILGGDADATTLSLANLTGGTIMLRYYFNK